MARRAKRTDGIAVTRLATFPTCNLPVVLNALLAVLALHVGQAVAPASDAIACEPGWIMVVQYYGREGEDKNFQTKNKILVNLSGSVPSGSHSHS